MSGRFVFFTGPCKWAMLDTPDQAYNCYKITQYLDKENQKKFHDAGLKLEFKTDDDGTFVTFRRYIDKLLDGMPEKPAKLIHDGEGNYTPFDGLIGNGSIVTTKIEVYPLKKMKGSGHRLTAVAVENLVPYENGQSDDELPF